MEKEDRIGENDCRHFLLSGRDRASEQCDPAIMELCIHFPCGSILIFLGQIKILFIV